MKTFFTILGGFAVAAVIFGIVSRMWFDAVPLPWIYSIKGMIGEAQGDEGTLNTMVLTSVVVGGLVAVAAFWGVLKMAKKQ